MSLNHPHSVDWRESLALNQRRTFFVMAMFVGIYMALGFLLDLYLHGAFIQHAPADHFQMVLNQLLTGQVTPTATLSMGAVALFSIFLTLIFHDRLMLLGTDYYEVKLETARTMEEQQLYHIVEELKIASGFRYMPKIYIIDADYMNAFASGYSEKSAMITVTRGLLARLDRSELQAVLGHEMSHIRHGDIKLTLMASVLSNLMLIVLDIFFYHMLYSPKDNERRSDNRVFFVIVILRYLLPTITVLLMLYLSRTREYMADAGSVELLRDNQPLGRALLKIAGDHEAHRGYYQRVYSAQNHEEVRRAAYIFDPASMGLQAMQSIAHIFSTHPPLEARLKAIGFQTKA